MDQGQIITLKENLHPPHVGMEQQIILMEQTVMLASVIILTSIMVSITLSGRNTFEYIKLSVTVIISKVKNELSTVSCDLSI